MLSVLRFTIHESKFEELAALGKKIDAAEPGIVEPRRKGDGFACTIDDSHLWLHHVEEVTNFLAMHDAPIREAVALGARVTFDVAIDPEDQAVQKYALLLPVRAQFLTTLGGVGVDLEISIYRPALTTDGTAE